MTFGIGSKIAMTQKKGDQVMQVMQKSEPCVELQLEPNAITLRLEVRLVPGEVNLSAEEGARWFAAVVQDAHNLLLLREATGDQRPGRLVRSGGQSWSRPEPLPPLLSEDEREALAWVASDSPITEPDVPEAAPTELPEFQPEPAAAPVSREEIGQALAASPPPEITEEPEPESRRPSPSPDQTKPGKALLKVLRQSPERLDIPTLKERAKLSDYMTRQTLKALVEAGKIEEEWVETGGRWGGKATYKPK
jgi:hypothetical protein